MHRLVTWDCYILTNIDICNPRLSILIGAMLKQEQTTPPPPPPSHLPPTLHILAHRPL